MGDGLIFGFGIGIEPFIFSSDLRDFTLSLSRLRLCFTLSLEIEARSRSEATLPSSLSLSLSFRENPNPSDFFGVLSLPLREDATDMADSDGGRGALRGVLNSSFLASSFSGAETLITGFLLGMVADEPCSIAMFDAVAICATLNGRETSGRE